MFSPEEWQYALHMPPFSWRILLKWPVFWERLGLVLWPAFSGVIMVSGFVLDFAGVDKVEVWVDGVLRSHQITNNGTLRDTCVYSIVASEWPTVKAHLTWQMEKPA